MVSRDGSQELQDNSADPKVPLPWYKEAAHAALEGVKVSDIAQKYWYVVHQDQQQSLSGGSVNTVDTLPSSC